MRAKNFRLRLFILTLVLLSAPAAFAQGDRLGVEYTVEVKDKTERLFHVTTHLRNIRQPRLALSLPVWTPGWYTIENYAKNILRFTVTDARGQRLPHRMSRKQTWDVETKGLNEIRIDFDYRADVLGLNQAKIADDFAFFTGTQLFLEPVGHRAAPSTVRFRVPAGWKIVSALNETKDPHVFTSPDYDALVDAPTEMGNFDVTRFEVEGKPHYFVATPAGAFNAEKSRQFTAMFDKFARAQGAIFGGLPYEKYVAFYFFMPAESNAARRGRARELLRRLRPARRGRHAGHDPRHRRARVLPPLERQALPPRRDVALRLLARAGVAAPLGLRGLHELLHQRLAPALGPAHAARSFWSRSRTPSPSTSPTRRAPTSRPPTPPPRRGSATTRRSPSASPTTRRGRTSARCSTSRSATTPQGRASLDDVMRALYRDFYLRGRGFTADDLLAVIKRVAGRDYTDFFRRHVFGVEVPPYDRILGHAGYRVEKVTRKTPHLGVLNARPAQGGLELVRLEPNSPATRAGLAPGDVILKIDGADFFTFNLGESAGKTVTLRYKRAGEEKETKLDIGALDETAYRIVELPNPSAEQLKIRAGWMATGK